MGKRQTTPSRFPVIGRHLISEQNPAYAPTDYAATEPPELPPGTAPSVSPETLDRVSRLSLSPIARFWLSVRRWLG